jgi:hypothetical protein
MKTLMRLRHAKSSWDDERLSDHDRPPQPPVTRTPPITGVSFSSPGSSVASGGRST